MGDSTSQHGSAQVGHESMSVELGRALFDGCPDGLFILEPRGCCVAINQRGADLTGYGRDELVGMQLTDLVEPGTEQALRRKDGSLIPVETSTRMLPDGNRLEIVRDISERKRVEHALRLYKQAIECSITGIAFADLQSCLIYVNPAFLRMWGYENPGEVLGQPVSLFGDPDEHTRELAASIVEQGAWVGEAVAKKKNGDPFQVEMQGSVVKDGAGNTIATMGSFIDITERRRVEEALQESEEKYRSLVESALDPMFTSDADGRYLYVNTAAAAMLGTTPQMMMGKTVDELFPPHVAEQYRKGVRHVIQTGETLIAEDKSEIDGRTVWFSSIVQPVRDAHGHVKAAQAVVRDITNLKQAEHALRESEERLRQAVRVAHIGMFDHDHVTDNIFWSPRQREIFGLGPHDPVSVQDLGPAAENQTATHDPLYPEDRGRIAQSVRRAHDPAGDGLFNAEHRIIRRDGSVRWVTVHSQTFFDGEGEARHAVRTVGAVRDITEAKEAEQKHERLQAELIQAQKMESIGRLAGGVAHDFNNMLNVIQGYTELALGQLDSTQPLYAGLEEIQKAARRSADLTRQLLAFARRQPVAPKVLDVNDVVAASLKMLGRLVGEHINQVWMPGHTLWPIRIDPAQIDQILANLVVNARDAITDVGQVTIRTDNIVLDESYPTLHAGAVPGQYVMLEVTDDGCGMDPETQAHVFEPFYTTKAEGQGTGLGLAMVYGIVKQNEGFINVESEVDWGTRVQIFLPRFAGPLADEIMGPAAAPKKGTETVLLVEDEPLVLRLSRTMLERLGYIVVVASAPGEAIRLADEHGGKMHLLVTDVVMPEMNGPDLAQRLLSLYPHLKCLFLSGYPAGASSPIGALGEGSHFLQKPFTMSGLAAKVREALEKT